jgi:hypothetical protein
MSIIEINGEPYLSTAEAANFLDVSMATFRKFQLENHLQSVSRPGMGQAKFFKKKDLEPLKEFRPTTNTNSEAKPS